ncbi:hypothetical protein SAY87_012661 [Trapa incisa]|uniref:Kinesin motor domain-containing protein n=1 Tax=Trapa incisa TaxID=236973 RepID=A0AAN7JJ22_9MYRT|nr:hypothetical protein SAY87_012661 [Trapa incisa]
MKSVSSNRVISETGFRGSGLSTSTIRSLLFRSVLSKKNSMSKNPKLPRSDAENVPPPDPNLPEAPGAFIPPLKQKEFSEVTGFDHREEAVVKPELPIEEKVIVSGEKCEALGSDPSVKVAVRIRPGKCHEIGGIHWLEKVSSDTLLVGDRRFTFDSVFDSRTSQQAIFQTVGVPLVKDALAGYNASILSYGQIGSGKTYTMWGPPSSMVEEPSSSGDLGLVPRIFHFLFSEIQKEEEKACERNQVNYQCRCSFLEIYNENIGDLLDQTQRNLQILDDPKNGLYVENLSEEYVTSYEEVAQILIKGLSSRKVGATAINSKSSRSHIIFTCVIESWCKETSSQCFSSSKTRRISFVDLAGSDTRKLDDVSCECAKEAKNVKKSLSYLGRLVHALAKRSQITNEDVPYKGSRLTHFLRESLGGNAKFTVICAISPYNKNDSETLSTLRFGQRVKCIKNDPVINEISQEDMNGLSNQIRQLKEELIRTKFQRHNFVKSGKDYIQRQYARESLNQLRMSLNRSLMIPHTDYDSEKEINVDENDVKELHEQLDKLETCKDVSREQSVKENADSIEKESCDTDDSSADFTNCQEEFETDETDSRQCFRDSQFLEEPALSDSPKIGNLQRKSIIFSSRLLSSPNSVSESSNIISNVLERPSIRQSQHIGSSIRTSMSLAASLQRGLEIIDYHQRSSAASEKSPVAFSFEHLTLKPSSEVLDKSNASIQTSLEDSQLADGMAPSFLCPSCQRKRDDLDKVEESLKNWIVPVDKMEDDLSEDKKRALELESICKEQEAKIQQLKQQVAQLGLGKEQADGQGRSPILCIEDSKNDNSLLEEVKDEKINCEIKEVQEELKHENKSSSFDSDEKEELLKEIHSLKSKLQQSHPDTPHNKSIDKLRSSLLRQSIDKLRKGISGGFQYNNSEEELERERERWTEMEGEWISLTDELRIDMEAQRRRAEKLEGELRLEKNCTEELDDALHRAVLGHAKMVEHYAELQEKYNDLAGKHRAIMEGIAEVKKAAAKAGAKGHGSRFAKSVAAELSAKRVEKERERELLRKENQRLRIQLRDTAEAVHAAGELLVRLREAEQATSAAEDNMGKFQEENEKLREQLEKIKRKHKMEMMTMKQYLAESKLPGSALPPLYRDMDDYENSNAHSTGMDSSEDEAEALLELVSNYYFLDHEDEPISFSGLPLLWGEHQDIPDEDDLKGGVYLHGSVEKGLKTIHREVRAWKIELDNVSPEIYVLSKENKCFKLQKPRKSYEDTIRSVLITVSSLHYLKRNPEASAKSLWDYMAKVFSMYEVRPAGKDLGNHISLISEAVKRDDSLAKCKFIASFLGENSLLEKLSREGDNSAPKPGFIVADDAMDAIEDDFDTEDDDDVFDSVCAICDNGGNLLCCEGRCMRSFHATIESGEESECVSLGFTDAEVEATQQFLCKNCEYKQHQCYVCGKLGSSDKSSGAEVCLKPAVVLIECREPFI